MTEYATLAGGCFWCTEAVFKDVIGVESVESGYIGGTTADGCIRLAPADVQHVYDILSIGSRVLIRR